MSLTPEDIERRRAAKRFNERLKLTASVLNASCIGVLGAAIILPAIDGKAALSLASVVWFFSAVVLHILAHALLTLYRSED